MPRIIALTYTILAVTALGTTTLAHSAGDDPSLRKDLERIAQKRIYFGHQSVGENLLEGIQQLSTIASVPIRVFETPTANGVKATRLGHTFVARNGDPFQKLKSFEHITAPLTTVQSGFKGSLKKLIGRAPYGAIENVRREEYNELLRQAYRGREPLFDLARVESTTLDETAVTGEWKGSVAPAMAPADT